MKNDEKDNKEDYYLSGRTFFSMIMDVFHPSYLEAENEIDKIRINPAKQLDSIPVKNGAD